jgi:membrane-bound transcription factor site-1 protease
VSTVVVSFELYFGVDCFWLLDAMLQYTAHASIPSSLIGAVRGQHKLFLRPETNLPERMGGRTHCRYGKWQNIYCCTLSGSHLSRYSKVLEPTLGEYRIRPLSPCPQLSWTTPKPLNVSAPSNLYKQQKLLSISFDANPGRVPQQPIDPQGMWDQMLVVKHKNTEVGMAIPFIGFVAIFVIAAFCIYHMNSVRVKPRRRRIGKGSALRRTFIVKHPVV